MKKLFFFSSLFLLVMTSAKGQYLPDVSLNDTANYPYWAEMMQDPDAKFSATVSAFETYWTGRTDRKGNGWKVFRRWEYINRDLVQADGKLPAPGQVAEEYRRYMAAHDGPLSANGNWSQIGPVPLPANATGQPNGLGRVNCVTPHPTNPNIIYAGSPSGGLWRTTDGALSWNVLNTATPTLGVSAVLLHPTDPNLILIGTGDRDAGDSPGMGVYRSLDGGTTWAASNAGMGNLTVGMMQRHPSDPNTILAVTGGGIYKSTDGGLNWVRKSSNTSHYKDIRFKPGDPTIVYATEGGKFYRSTNTGESWTQITAGVITGSRLVIGVSAAAPSTVYLVQTSGVFAGLLKSTNDGVSFTTQSTSPNLMDYNCDGGGSASQAWYDLCVAVDPNNANTIYVGGINIWKSTNGGVNWTISSHWVGASWGYMCAPSVHADIHSLDFSAANGKLFTGCDGGIYSTSNGGTTWTDNSSGLAIAQIYKIGQSATKQSLTMNGYQDNGTAKNTGPDFTTVIGGDGMECLVDYSDTMYRYGSLYYGDIMRSTGTGYSTIAANGSNGITEDGGWVTPYILHETNPSTMFAGYKNVWRSTNVKTGSSWNVSWTKISSGETGNCTVLEQSPANLDLLYVVRNGSMKRSENCNATTPTWTACTLPGSGLTPTDLEAHPTIANTVYATAGTKIYKSTDKGASWTSISGTLPSVNINCLVYDKNSNEGIYVGNKTNVFYKDATISDWIPFSTGLPMVDVRELEIFYDAANPANNRLKAATYGRGLWQSDLYSVFAVSPPNQNVTHTAGSTTFTVSANTGTSWTVSSNSTWCTVSGGGTGNGTITANYTENPTTLTRVATITATPNGGLLPQSVTVTQNGAPPVLTVSPPNQNVTYAAGSTNFSVVSNTSWSVTSSESWCTVTPTGTGNGTIVATFTENTVVTTRVATITVTAPSLPAQTVTVTQSGAPPTLGVLPSGQTVPAPAGTAIFTVTSNTNWTAVSNATWCTVTAAGSGNGNIDATYLENLSVNPRVATITVTVSGLPPVAVTLTQEGALPTLGVMPPNQTVMAPSGSTSFTVTSNTSWNAVSDATWCTVTTAGSGNGTIDAIYDENTSVNQRIANITVTVQGLSAVVVTVTQLGTAPSLTVTPANRDVSPMAGSTTFTVTSNADWTASSDSAWCVVTPAGSGSGIISANYGENPYYMTRVATITVSVTGLPAQLVTVTQSQSTVSVNETGLEGLYLYPNPTGGVFRIGTDARFSNNIEIRVLDYTGTVVVTTTCSPGGNCVVDLSKFSQGCYFVRMGSAGEWTTRKLVIIR